MIHTRDGVYLLCKPLQPDPKSWYMEGVWNPISYFKWYAIREYDGSLHCHGSWNAWFIRKSVNMYSVYAVLLHGHGLHITVYVHISAYMVHMDPHDQATKFAVCLVCNTEILSLFKWNVVQKWGLNQIVIDIMVHLRIHQCHL